MAFYTVAHGPPWRDATLAWQPATAEAPPVLNDVGYEPRRLPQIALDKNTGWRDLPEMVDSREGRTYGIGEVAYPPRYLGKTLVPEGRIEADDRLDLLELQNAMVQGFGDRDVEGTMTVTPWPPFGGTGEDLVVWTFKALVLDLKFDADWTLSDGFYEWGFVLTLRMSDPHFYVGETGYL